MNIGALWQAHDLLEDIYIAANAEHLRTQPDASSAELAFARSRAKLALDGLRSVSVQITAAAGRAS